MSKPNAVEERLDPADVFDAIARVARPMAAAVNAYHNNLSAGQSHTDIMYLAGHGNRDMIELYDQGDSGGFAGNTSLESRVMDARCAFATAHALGFLLKHYDEITKLIPGEALTFDEYDNAFYGAASDLGPMYDPERREEWIRKHEPDG